MFGRMLTYVGLGVLLVSTAQSVPVVANFLQKYMNILLGPLLILIGLIFFGIIKFNMGDGAGIIANKLLGRVQHFGLLGACLLGIVFALSFCPVSAALFFGSLFSIAVKNDSRIIIPSVYGIGTALPVMAFAIIMGFSARLLSGAYDKVAAFELWARRVTAAVFVFAGVYYCVIYLPGAF
jgi:hypothetical protein